MKNLAEANVNGEATVGSQGEHRESPSIFPAYSTYKDSGVEWVDTLPAHWGKVALKWVSKIFAGGTPDKTKAYYWENGSIPWLNSGAVNQVLITEPSNFITTEAFNTSSARWIDPGSLVIALAGQGKTKGMVAQLAIRTTCNQSMAAITPAENLKPRYLFWWISSNYQNIRNMAGGDLRDGLNLELIGDIPALIPSEEEQTQIARFLDHETARIDALIKEQLRLIELIKEKRQSVISHAVTKGLDPTVPMKDSGVEWLGEVPVHWIVSRIKNVASFITSGPRGWSDYIDESGEDIFLQSGDMDNRMNVLFDKAKRITTPEGAEGVRTRLQDGDVVVCITGANTGRVAVLGELNQAAYVNQHLGLIRPYTLACNSRYLGYALSSTTCQTYFNIEQYGLKEGLSLTDVAEAPLMVPPLAEQIQLVAVIESQLATLDGLTADSEMTVELLQERRSALISAAVTGKIDVRGWQPLASALTPKLELEAV